MKHILVTNIHHVRINDLMLHAHALLISDQLDNQKHPHCTLRGFGTDSAWEIFQIHLKSANFTRQSAQSSSVMVLGEGDDAPVPLASGDIFTFADGGPVVQVIKPFRSTQDLDVLELPGDKIEEVWARLPAKVARYWDAPNIPALTWSPVDRIRRVMGIR